MTFGGVHDMLGSLVFALTIAAGPAKLERLAVFEFKGDASAGVRAEMTRVARRAAVAEAAGRADVIDPEMIALLFKDSPQAGACVDAGECELELVGALGARFAVIGTAHVATGQAVLEVKLFESQGRRVRPLVADSVSGGDELALLTSTDALVRKVFRAAFARLDAEERARTNVARSAEWERGRATAKGRRTVGWWTAGSGVAVGAVAGWFALQFLDQDRKLQTSLPTAADISRAQDSRDRYQKLAIGAGAVGGALALTGLGVVLFNRDPGPFRVDAAPVPGGAALSMGGAF